MRRLLRRLAVTLVTVHGLIHLMGTVKGLEVADVAALREPIGTYLGLAWLAAAALVLASAAMLAFHVRLWWAVMAGAAVVSQVVIGTSWSDAKAGTAANGLMLLTAGYGYLSKGPKSAQARLQALAAEVTTSSPTPTVVTEEDLAGLPGPVARYVRRGGAVGQPRVVSFRAVIHGRIRGGPDRPWMPFTGEQVNTYGEYDGRGASRLFFMDATMNGLPTDVLHVFKDGHATMTVKVASLVRVVDARGPEMDRAETVTLFNDLCVLAPAALVDAPVSWSPLDERRVRGRFTHAGITVTADLLFDQHGDLVDFVSDDRLRASEDGRRFNAQRWSTPLSDYGPFGLRRLARRGSGRWHAPAPEGEFDYLEFHADEVTYNVDPGSARSLTPV